MCPPAYKAAVDIPICDPLFLPVPKSATSLQEEPLYNSVFVIASLGGADPPKAIPAVCVPPKPIKCLPVPKAPPDAHAPLNITPFNV